MENSNLDTAQKDEKLWKLAKRRAAFKRHLISYILVNSFLWAIWFFSGYVWNNYDNDGGFGMHHSGLHFPWPVFVMFFWGIGLVFDFINSYLGFKDTLEEKEYQKLMNKKN